MKGYVFLKNAVILTATSLILRTIGIVFRIYLAGIIGSEGIGLYQLIFSVYILVSTFASAGVSTAVTRLISENSLADKKTGQKIIKKAVTLTLLIAVTSSVAVFFGSQFIGEKILNDARAVISLKILSFSLPFMGMSACFRGYFIAKHKTAQPSVAQIFEQLIRIVVTLTLLVKFANKGITFCTAIIIFGDTVAEIISCLFIYALYKLEINKTNGKPTRLTHIYGKLLKIILPLSAGRYITTALHTAENILVPSQLGKNNASKGRGLSLFGALKGMAMPILFFPASFLTAFSTMLIPVMAEASALGDQKKVSETTKKTLGITLVLSIFTATVFLFFGNQIAQILYNDNDIGYILTFLAPIVPFMYLESVVTGILKGLDQQMSMFYYNCIDGGVRIIAVLMLVPFLGINGFLGIMIVSNIFTSSICTFRLLKVTKIKINLIEWIAKPLLFGFIGGEIAKFLTTNIENLIINLVIAGLTQTSVFFLGMIIFGKEDVLKTIKRYSKET